MTRRGFFITLITLLALAVSVASATTASGSTKRAATTTLTGAGATFPQPLISAWIPAYQSASGNTVNYAGLGSGAGISQITNRGVDFGASDAPMSASQQSACNGCMQFPWAFSGTSIAYNGTGLSSNLHITGPVLADIYLGKITKWNDPALVALNPKAGLPDKSITPIWRSDSSGTSFNFTDYLSAVSPEFKTKIGVGTQPAFTVGVGASKSSGVAAKLGTTDGGIIYIDVAYALANHYAMFAIKNRAGTFTTPGLRNIQSTANLTLTATPDNGYLLMSVVDPPAIYKKVPKIVVPKTTNKKKRAASIAKQVKNRNKIIAQNGRLAIAYPICTFTYVIVPKQAKHADALKNFLNWVYADGQKPEFQTPLRFVALPTVVKQASLGLVSQITQAP